MRVLGIETSCDETGVAVYDTETGLLADRLYSQVELHARFGGVVPELASRDHIRKALPLIQEVLEAANTSLQEVDGIAYTAGPGLVGALLVGASVGRALGMSLGVPSIGVHHMEGHLLAPMLEEHPPQFPFVALLVSGGHTQLVRVEGIGRYSLLGESLDDAAGEAFDKVGKMLGLEYPGGPRVAALAQLGIAGRYKFPRPMTNRPGLDFSFSGLKTFVRNTLEQERDALGGEALPQQVLADVAFAFEDAVVQTFVIKCRRALEATGLKTLVIAGGVSANLSLRAGLQAMMEKHNGQLYYAQPRFCTDNGAMIAYAGAQRLAAGEKDGLELNVKARWPLNTLPLWGKKAFRSSNMDIVYIEDLRIETIIGIFDWERKQKQTVSLDLQLATDISVAAASEDIEKTLDYKSISKRIRSFIEQSEFLLVETMAQKTAELILEEFAVPWLRLRVGKPGAVTGAKDVGVIIERGIKP